MFLGVVRAYLGRVGHLPAEEVQPDCDEGHGHERLLEVLVDAVQGRDDAAPLF